jgi:CRP/FNR family cyclic AMP-dependent transcriptional regulator
MIVKTDILLSYGAVYKKVSAGEVIFQEGDTGFYYHQLVEGKISWSNFNDDGREILQEVVSPGECFGELPLFDQQAYACTAVALTDCIIIRLAANSFTRLLEEHPEISMCFTKLLSEKLRFRLFLLREISGHSPEHTIEELFKYYHKNSKKVCSACNKLLLTRQQIANLTGMRVETVIRATKNLENKGKLTIVKGKIFLLPQGGSACHKVVIPRTRER